MSFHPIFNRSIPLLGILDISPYRFSNHFFPLSSALPSRGDPTFCLFFFVGILVVKYACRSLFVAVQAVDRSDGSKQPVLFILNAGGEKQRR